jgi:hypothetical protein
VHTDVFPDVTTGVNPDEAENVSEIGVAEYVRSPGEVKLIVWLALLIVKVRVTPEAAS